MPTQLKTNSFYGLEMSFVLPTSDLSSVYSVRRETHAVDRVQITFSHQAAWNRVIAHVVQNVGHTACRSTHSKWHITVISYMRVSQRFRESSVSSLIFPNGYWGDCKRTWHSREASVLQSKYLFQLIPWRSFWLNGIKCMLQFRWSIVWEALGARMRVPLPPCTNIRMGAVRRNMSTLSIFQSVDFRQFPVWRTKPGSSIIPAFSN